MRAVIFDMDGVIVDSEKQWRLCEGDFFRSLLPAWRDEHHKHVVGLGVVDLYHWLVKEFGLAASKASFLARCQELADEVYRKRATRPAGLAELIDDLRSAKIAIAIASSSPREWIEIVLGRFAMRELFEAVVSADDAQGKTKPEPDIYLKAAALLGIEPRDCLAIEDSKLGVAAAKRAGMFCVAFRNGDNDEQDLSQAEVEIRGFRESSAQTLNDLYRRPFVRRY